MARAVTVNAGVWAAFGAAVSFGIATPVAKWLLASTDPWLMAGLLYAGSGIGLWLSRWLRPLSRVLVTRHELVYLVCAIAIGGVIAPVLLMQGLARMPAAGASLLLNAEGIFTALLAWFVFRENVDRRVAFGMLLIAIGTVVLAWTAEFRLRDFVPGLLILGACLGWAVDNNLTRKLSHLDATWLASWKGVAAGCTNLLIALILGATWPALSHTLTALLLGSVSYGLSLVLFVKALRHLGAARTTAYFAAAPFIGAIAAILWLGEPWSWRLIAGAACMGVGLWLHLTEHHEHLHHHTSMEHEHEHTHDEHHQHGHSPEVAPDSRHSHRHRHGDLTHSHSHFPDTHHRHEH